MSLFRKFFISSLTHVKQVLYVFTSSTKERLKKFIMDTYFKSAASGNFDKLLTSLNGLFKNTQTKNNIYMLFTSFKLPE